MKKKRTITKNLSSYKKSKRKNSRKKTNKKTRTRTLKKKELLEIITSLTTQKKKRSKKKKSRKKITQRKDKRGGFSGVAEGAVNIGQAAQAQAAQAQAAQAAQAQADQAAQAQADQAQAQAQAAPAVADTILGFPGQAPAPAPSGFGGPQAVVDDPRPAYEKEWVDLNNQEKAQAEELEFSDDSWPTQPPNWVEWGTLENDKQLAAEGLGFTEELWKGLQFEVGETVERKNVGSPWNDGVVTNIIPLRVTILSSGEGEGIQWADVKKKQVQSIPAPSTLGYEKSWEDLTVQERLGAQALDWNEPIWKSGIAPPNYVEWDELSDDKITAAQDLGFTQESWNNLTPMNSWSPPEKKIEVDDDEDTSLPTTEQTVPEGKKGDSTWGKLKGLFRGTEYEQFIEQSGLELKNLFTSYLTEYLQDIQKGETVDVLRAKYESFVDKYYQEAIQKDKQLIQKLKDV